MQHKEIVFLGCSYPVLAMWLEILVQNEVVSQRNFKVIHNLPIPHKPTCLFLPAGVKIKQRQVNNWNPETFSSYVLGVNLPTSKKLVFQAFEKSHALKPSLYRNLIHPKSILATTATLESGVVINPGVTIAPFAHLGSFVTVNRNASIGHHTKLDAFVTINPAVNIAGFCTIQESVQVGIGATILDGLTIGKNSTIGAGSLVTKDIPPNVIAYGVPAKVVKEK